MDSHFTQDQLDAASGLCTGKKCAVVSFFSVLLPAVTTDSWWFNLEQHSIKGQMGQQKAVIMKKPGSKHACKVGCDKYSLDFDSGCSTD